VNQRAAQVWHTIDLNDELRIPIAKGRYVSIKPH
jgi:hypothetical protein